MIERDPFFMSRFCCKVQSFVAQTQGFLLLDALAALAVLMVFVVLITQYHAQHIINAGVTRKQLSAISALVTRCENLFLQGGCALNEGTNWQLCTMPVKIKSAPFSLKPKVPFAWVKTHVDWPEAQSTSKRFIIAGYAKPEDFG